MRQSPERPTQLREGAARLLSTAPAAAIARQQQLTWCVLHKWKSAVTKVHFRAGARAVTRRISAEPLGTAAEAHQRVGPFVVIPGLLRELGADPARVLISAGLEATALDDMENRILFVAMGRLMHECALKTGCLHFGLLAGQRMTLSHLGLPGQLIRYSPTLGTAIRTFVEYQHLNNQGMVTFLLEQDGVAELGPAIYQKGTERVDQIYDAAVAMACNVIRELFGSRWVPERVLFSRAKPAAVTPYHRFFFARCRFDSERTAMLFPAHWLARPMPEADLKLFQMLEKKAREKSGMDIISRLRRTLRADTHSRQDFRR